MQTAAASCNLSRLVVLSALALVCAVQFGCNLGGRARGRALPIETDEGAVTPLISFDKESSIQFARVDRAAVDSPATEGLLPLVEAPVGSGGMRRALQVELDPGARLCLGPPDDGFTPAAQWRSDWRAFTLLAANVFAVEPGASVTVSLADASGAAWSHRTPVSQGWNRVRFDLTDAAAQINLARVSAVYIDVGGAGTGPSEFLLERLALIDNRRELLAALRPGELYARQVGRRYIVGARDVFELEFRGGVIVAMRCGGTGENLAAEGGMGPWPAPAPPDWFAHEASPVVYDDPEHYAAWGPRVRVWQDIQASRARVDVSGAWEFYKPGAERAASRGRGPALRWSYAIYADGRVFVRVEADSAGRAWRAPTVVCALAFDARSRLTLARDLDLLEDGAAAILPPAEAAPGFIWIPFDKNLARDVLEVASVDERRAAVLLGAAEAKEVVSSDHLLFFGATRRSVEAHAFDWVDAYREPADLKCEVGSGRFHPGDGAYHLVPQGGLIRAKFDPLGIPRESPRFVVEGDRGANCTAYASGRVLRGARHATAPAEWHFAIPGVVAEPVLVEVHLKDRERRNAQE